MDDYLTPTEDLFVEVLTGRWRAGERVWTFEQRHRHTARRLEAKGLVGWKSGIAQGSIIAWLTPAGREAFLSPDYVAPVEKNTKA